MGASHDFRREHADALAEGVAPLVLDRQRIIHSAAFRRLEYKTQVFLAVEADNFRTRLTHTLEVADLARLLAGLLGHSADLAEAVALAHDLGHAPFGHAGERALDECMAGHGGFEHNAHSLRVVEYLEHPYPEFRGLNLTRGVRECLAKHSTQFDRPGSHPLQDGSPPPAEGAIAALADRLGYGLHDLQDGIYAGLLPMGDLGQVELWRDAAGTRLGDSSRVLSILRPTIDRIQRALVDDVLRETAQRRSRRGEESDSAASACISLSEGMDARLREMEAFLFEQLYRHNLLVRMDTKARRIIHAVFAEYVREPALMPARFARRIPEIGLHRVVADYVAGMTDRFCLAEHSRLFDPNIRA